MMLNLRIEGYF